MGRASKLKMRKIINSIIFLKKILILNFQHGPREHCHLWNYSIYGNTEDPKNDSKINSVTLCALRPHSSDEGPFGDFPPTNPKTILLMRRLSQKPSASIQLPSRNISINYPNCQACEKTWHTVTSIFRISTSFQK